MIDRLARAAERHVSRETYERLEAFASLVRAENQRQNLVSPATLDTIWERHILDSAQLLRWEPRAGASWVDLGSGAGFPGIVVACLAQGPVTLVEPRRLRADFLYKATKSLGLDAIVRCAKAERICGTYDAITARAVASLTKVLEISHHLSTGKSRWVLPKGRTARIELAEAQRTWQGVFHVEPSVTEPQSSIIVATGVRARRG